MKETISIREEVWLIFVMLFFIIILLLINKFPIEIVRTENKQVWEANCKCECIAQEPKPCINFNWTFEKPNSFSMNYSFVINISEECRFCWLNSATS